MDSASDVKQAHWENLTCCLASHMQEVKAIYFCSVNCIALESLVLDYPLARCCPNSEQYPWCVILMKKKAISNGNLTSIEDQGFRAMVIKVQWNKPWTTCEVFPVGLFYISVALSKSALSQWTTMDTALLMFQTPALQQSLKHVLVHSQNCLEKYINNILFSY